MAQITLSTDNSRTTRIPAEEPKQSICLIIPPSPFLLDERVFPSLGILKVASSLEQQGHDVSVLDLSGVENYLQLVEEFARTTAVEIVGITATTPQLPAVMAIARSIRAKRPALKQILGGPHVTLVYSAQRIEKKHGSLDGRGHGAARRLEAEFDVIVSGDGERAILEAIRPDSPSFIDGDDHRGNYFMTDRQFTESPWPSRHLIDLPSYHYSIEDHPATSLIAQLGCPFNCGFCGGRNSRSLRMIRTRTTESILDEIRFLHIVHGYTGFMFYDDELNVNKGLVDLMNRICDLQEELGVNFRLRGFVKSELFTDEQAAAMYRAGFRWILTGFEAANERILLNINKKATLADNTRAVETAKNNGLKVKALMSCGHPGETEESIRSIRDWVVSNAVDDFDCTIITPYPGTPYYDLAVRHQTQSGVWTYTAPATGDQLHAHEMDYTVTANYYKGVPDTGYQSFVFTDALKPEEIVKLRDWVEHDARHALGIPFNQSRPALRYEHSMGQGLPASVLRHAAKKEPIHA